MIVALLYAWQDHAFVARALPRLKGEHQVWANPLDPSVVGSLLHCDPMHFERIVVVLGPGLVHDIEAQKCVEAIRTRHGGSMMSFATDPTMDRRAIPLCLRHSRVVFPLGEPVAELCAELGPRLETRAVYDRGVVISAIVVVCATLVAAMTMAAWVWWSASGAPAFMALSADIIVEDDVEVASAAEVTIPPEIYPGDAPSPVPAGTVVRPAQLDSQEIRFRRKHPMVFRYLDGGTFTMGRQGSTSPENQQHEVSVTGFWMADAEVTQAQWFALMGERPSNIWSGEGDDYPVQEISWEDTLVFLNALSDRQGQVPCYSKDAQGWHWDRSCDGFRLPTEAEWEYAVRAGSTTRYHFPGSKSNICKFGNTADRSARQLHTDWSTIGCDDGHLHIAPVKALKPNEWLLYDMHGNVAEWVWDRYGVYPEGPTVDVGGPKEGLMRITRGGNYMRHPNIADSSTRLPARRTFKKRTIGFRVARSEASILDLP